MIYLDYSATTPVSDKVLEEDRKFHQRSFANSNSLHKLGIEALNEITKTTQLIKKVLNCPHHNITYTSGATESNNLALKGVAYQYKHLGNHIITTPFEHGSITATLNYLSKQGFVVDVLDYNNDGLIDLDDLKALLTDQTILVSIGLVNSELGIVQDLKAIKDIVKAYPQVILHSDMTQAIGKAKLDYSLADIISLSAHKIYGFKGVGALLHREHLKLTPVIHGGKSISSFRGGTPPTSLIFSLGVALEQAYLDFEKKLTYIQELKDDFITKLKDIDGVLINSNHLSVPHIINISFIKTRGLEMQKYLSDRHIYVSTTSACSSEQAISKVVKELTGDNQRSVSSLRISLSHLTTKKELYSFIEVLGDYHESR